MNISRGCRTTFQCEVCSENIVWLQQEQICSLVTMGNRDSWSHPVVGDSHRRMWSGFAGRARTFVR